MTDAAVPPPDRCAYRGCIRDATHTLLLQRAPAALPFLAGVCTLHAETCERSRLALTYSDDRPVIVRRIA